MRGLPLANRPIEFCQLRIDWRARPTGASKFNYAFVKSVGWKITRATIGSWGCAPHSAVLIFHLCGVRSRNAVIAPLAERRRIIEFSSGENYGRICADGGNSDRIYHMRERVQFHSSYRVSLMTAQHVRNPIPGHGKYAECGYSWSYYYDFPSRT